MIPQKETERSAVGAGPAAIRHRDAASTGRRLTGTTGSEPAGRHFRKSGKRQGGARAVDAFVESWLFSPEPDWETLALQGAMLGFDIHSPYLVMVIETDREEPGQSGAELGQDLFHRWDYCFRVQNRLLLLQPCQSRGKAKETFYAFSREVGSDPRLALYGGAAISEGAPEDIRRCYTEAKLACQTARKLEEGGLLLYDEVSLDFIVESIPGNIRKALGSRIFGRCSQTERKEIAEFVHIYFQEGGNLNGCADRLFVHRNTVQYRLDRIKKKTGYDLRDPRDACLLYMGIL